VLSAITAINNKLGSLASVHVMDDTLWFQRLPSTITTLFSTGVEGLGKREVWDLPPSRNRFQAFSYFLPANRTLAVKARCCPPKKAPKFGASMLLTTVFGFFRSRAFTASIRSAHR
jgi:hypothetical protein